MHTSSIPMSTWMRCGWMLIMSLLIWMGHPGIGQAQGTGTVGGRVVDAQSGEPLSDVNVVIEGTILGDATDAEGRFRIENVPPGSHTVQISTLGYRTARRTVTVEAGGMASITFRLTPTRDQDGDREVTATRAEFQPVARLDEQQLREINVPDLGAALRHLPGAGASRQGPLGLGPNVRGLTEAEVGAYIDGIRSFAGGPLRMDSPLSHIDPTAVAQMEVVKGPYALAQGAGLMSTIRMETKAGEPGTNTSGQLQSGFRANGSAAETAGTLTGSLFGIGYRMHGAYRTGEDYTAGDGQSVPAAYTSGGVRGAFVYPLSSASTLTVDGGYQDQRDIQYPGLPLNAESFETGQGHVHYQLQQEGSALRALDVQAYAAQTLHRMTNEGKPTAEGDAFGAPQDIAVNAELQNVGGRVATDWAPAPRWRMQVGGDVYHTYRDATRSLVTILPGGSIVPPFYDSNQVWPGVTITDAGVFATVTRPLGMVEVFAATRADVVWADAERPSATFLDNASVRPDQLSTTDTNLSGALTLTVPLAERWTLVLGGGSVARTADAMERYADRFTASRGQANVEVQGNPTLDPERSTQGDIWVEGNYERFNLRVNAFGRHLSNYITLEPTGIDPLLPSSPEPVFRYVNGTATFWGGEVQGQYVVNPLLTLQAQGSYLWGEDETLDEPALGVYPLSADVNARIEAPFSETLFMETTVHWAAEQDRVATTRGEVPTDGYTTLDLRLGFTPISGATFTVAVENLTDVTYAHHLNAQNPFAEGPDEARILEPGRTLNVHLRVSF